MKPEILAPAGSEECAYASLNAGADAIYLGLQEFSARQAAENFNVEKLTDICAYAHLLGAKVYVCLNTLVKDSETDSFFSCARAAWNAGADALLVQDIFLGKVLKQIYPEIVLHLSTQGGCCNEYGAEVAKEYGFSRAVLARETPIGEIEKISKIIETEAFVQGALCSSFSGQCYFSSFAGGNSGNRGRCKQPCRKLYSIDRRGFEEKAYALSLADLSLGGRIGELAAAGVVSFKIEGRMRRPEYAAAAVSYYKTLLKGGDATRAFHDLKCAFNRGDYTEGLGFGQKKSLLSREVQGHIGQDVGQVSLNKRGYFCKSDFVPEKGDGFKILRAGKEVGGAALSSVDKAGFYLCTNSRLKEGDRVRVTTSGAAGRQALSVKRLRPVSVALEFIAGKKPRAAAEGYVFEGEEILERAKNAPLSEEELISCFQKTDRLPFAPETAATLQDAFLQKSKLNAFRRAFYEGLSDFLISRRERLKERRVPVPSFKGETKGLCAYIAAEPMRGAGEIFICKPCEYANMRTLEGESYLYLPPFFTGEDEALISPLLEKVNGIYCEGYYGIALAKKYGKKLFAGTGFNITNRYAAAQIGEIAKHYALSKELSNRECDEIGGAGFRLAGGGIKIMDLIYCPFSLDCNHCDRKKEYALTDEENRTFPLRRYALSGSCRFEVYNCARLLDTAGGNALFDFSCGQTEGLPATKGRSERSMQ